jgi:hypothetical protein
MRFSLPIFVFVAIMALELSPWAVSLAEAQENAKARKTVLSGLPADVAKKEAEQSLPIYLKLAAMQGKSGELDGPGSGSGALGDPFPVFMVRLDSLQKMDDAPGASAATLPSYNLHQLIFPFASQVHEINDTNARILGSIVVQKEDTPTGGQLVTSSSGNTALTRLMVKLRADHSKRTNTPSSKYTAVTIPALPAYFLSVQREGEGQILIPVYDMKSLGLKMGEEKKVSELLPILVRAAKEHNGEPR